MLYKQEKFVCPKRTLSEWIEKLKQTVTVEEITEEEVEPIYLRMTRYNFYHSWDEKPDTLQIYRVVQDNKSKIYYDYGAEVGITDIVVIFETKLGLAESNCNLLQTQLLIWRGIDACDCYKCSEKLTAYLMYLDSWTHEDLTE